MQPRCVGFVFMRHSDCYKIGHVLRAHGLKGEVTISLNAESPTQWKKIDHVLVDLGGQLVPHFIQHISVRDTKAFVKWEDVNTVEAARQLQGCGLYLPKALRPASGRGEFYNDEVLGFAVVDKQLGELGIVREVHEHGPNRFLVFDREGKEHLLPVNAPFIRSINKTARKITVDLPEGFLEI